MRQTEFRRQKIKQKLSQSRQRNAVGPSHFFKKPIAQLQETPKGRAIVAPDQRRALDEIAAVADQVPISREAPKPLHGCEVEQLILQDFIRWLRLVFHLPLLVVSHNRRASQPFQNANLDFLRPKRNEPVEARAKALQVFTGQTGDEIGMNMNASLPAQKSKILFQPAQILPAADQLADLLIERLHADLKLQRAGRKFRDDRSERLRQSVWNHFKMKKQARLVSLQKKLQQRLADIQVQVERAIHELEMLHPAVEQPLQRLQKFGQWRLPHWNIKG